MLGNFMDVRNIADFSKKLGNCSGKHLIALVYNIYQMVKSVVNRQEIVREFHTLVWSVVTLYLESGHAFLGLHGTN